MAKVGVLEKIDIELKRELSKLGDCSAAVALGPHRTAFDKILREVRSIKPILVKVSVKFQWNFLNQKFQEKYIQK